MDYNQGILLAEQMAHERQEQIIRAADQWYLTGELPQEPAIRERVAELLITVAVWLAPERQVASRQSPVVS